ncbi:hypothetical protein PINS_up013413 [Pythium insidiosum]|nr:hypothetical protein PINS_up013413 [Pythium insidiosum]
MAWHMWNRSRYIATRKHRRPVTSAAFLRQGNDVPDNQKYDSVEECLELLDLHLIAEQIILGSSVEQMKCLTIGVELAA